MTETTKWGSDWRDALAAWRAPKPARLTDAEIVASFMEPRPTCKPSPGYQLPIPEPQWWAYGNDENGDDTWVPLGLDDLNRLRMVEERLSGSHWFGYADALFRGSDEIVEFKAYIHASSGQKLAALAHVLRGEVEKRES